MSISIRNPWVELQIGPRGELVALKDLAAGQDLAVSGRPVAFVRRDSHDFPVTAARGDGVRLWFEFGPAGTTVELRLRSLARHWVMEVVSVQGRSVDDLTFLDIGLKLKGVPDESLSACALALNLQTRVDELPGPNTCLRAACCARIGLAGARAAIVIGPAPEFRGLLQEAVLASPDLPHSPLGGPWALDDSRNLGSYLFNFWDVTEQTVDDWIRLLKAIGFTQLDFHGGKSFRFGDCRPDPKMYPGGRASLKRVIDRLHDAGILCGLHTYAHFIDKGAPWVSPVPDPRLAVDRTFTLAGDLDAAGGEVRVEESTADMSAITGFFVRNSAVVRIDNELIQYTGAAGTAPHGFRGCTRGAHGTQPAAHRKGARVHHLRECFGLFAPDGDSSLLQAVAQSTADMYNACGFDMMYLDALDGEDVLGGKPYAWHYGSKFVFEIWKRLGKPAVVEMSTFHHHLWYVRSRMGAWDHPNRSHKRFIDIHVAANENCRRMFLPPHLGWWAIKTWQGIQGEPTFSDDMEYLCARCIGWDSSLALMGIEPSTFASRPVLQRLAEIVRRYETLRHARRVPESVKAALRAPGAEFRLVQGSQPEAWEFRPVSCVRHTVTSGEGDGWGMVNPYEAQVPRLRIEALMSVTPYEAPENRPLLDFAREPYFDEAACVDTVAGEMRRAPGKEGLDLPCVECSAWWKQPPAEAGPGQRFSPTDHGIRTGMAPVPSWAHWDRVFHPTIDLGECQALGVWVHGDGRGEVLNLQTRSYEHDFGGVADRHITVDFTGWRYFELVETEGERIDACTWPYSGNVYAIYREVTGYACVERVGVWLNRLPREGKAAVRLSPVRALKLVKASLVNPVLTVNGQSVMFPVSLESGCYLECSPDGKYDVYGPEGNRLGGATVQGAMPRQNPGDNRLGFACSSTGMRVRARITVMTEAEKGMKG